MRVVLQIVKQAHVELNGETISKIGKGFVLLVGFNCEDNEYIAKKMAEKIAKLRIFPDENGKTNLSLDKVDGEILSVSQFTLYGSVKEGNRPSFVEAMPQEKAGDMYQYFLSELGKLVPKLQSNVFHTDCEVHIVNDGPFTLVLDSKELIK